MATGPIIIFAFSALAAILGFVLVDQRKEDRRAEGGTLRVNAAEDISDDRG